MVLASRVILFVAQWYVSCYVPTDGLWNIHLCKRFFGSVSKYIFVNKLFLWHFVPFYWLLTLRCIVHKRHPWWWGHFYKNNWHDQLLSQLFRKNDGVSTCLWIIILPLVWGIFGKFWKSLISGSSLADFPLWNPKMLSLNLRRWWVLLLNFS